ncbi:MAG: PrsW family intramembrane metalloprotease [Gemmatales bacterium]|nr:MAG: PrsW family intramembrane metalloprotease [Gemmatales bacterium]
MSILLLALVPALAVLYYYYERDRHPEPWGWVAIVFIAGALSAFLALVVERWLEGFNGFSCQQDPFLFFFLQVGIPEETVKMLVVVVLVFWRSDFDEPVDGLIYGTAAALGFTFAEDFLSYLSRPDQSPWPRVVSVVAHPWFSCFWAGALGEAKFLSWKKGIPLVATGLIVSAFVHGLYDYLIEVGEGKWFWLRQLVVPLMITLYWVLEIQLERLHGRQARHSPADVG